MFKWSDVMAQDEHVKDLQREAEVERQARSLSTSITQSAAWPSRLVHRLGHQLVNWGCYLQSHTRSVVHN